MLLLVEEWWSFTVRPMCGPYSRSPIPCVIWRKKRQVQNWLFIFDLLLWAKMSVQHCSLRRVLSGAGNNLMFVLYLSVNGVCYGAEHNISWRGFQNWKLCSWTSFMKRSEVRYNNQIWVCEDISPRDFFTCFFFLSWILGYNKL